MNIDPNTDAPLPYRYSEYSAIAVNEDIHDRSRQYYFRTWNGALYELGEQEYFLCHALDGTRSFREIESEFRRRFGTRLSPKLLANFIDALADLGLITTVDATARDDADELPSPYALPDLPPLYGSRTRGNLPFGHVRIPFCMHLFNPEPLFKAIGYLIWPIRRILVWLVIPVIWFSGLIMFKHQNELLSDLQANWTNLSILVAIFVGLTCDNLLARVAQGVVAVGFGAPIRDCGISAFMGILPRFYIDDIPIKRLPRRAELWCYATPFFARSWLMFVGTAGWLAFRGQMNWTHTFFLLLCELGFISASLSMVPFIPGDGFRFLATYVEMPNLRRLAFRMLRILVQGRRLPRHLTVAERWALGLFGGATVISYGALFIAGYLWFGWQFVSTYQGAGAAIYSIIITASLAWLLVAYRKGEFLKNAAKTARAPPEEMLPVGVEIDFPAPPTE